MTGRLTCRLGLLALTVLAALLPTARAADTPAGVEFFEKRVRPLLVQRCYECHSREAKSIKGELLLDSRAGVLKGGNSGPAIVPGEPDKSLLLKAVRHEIPDLKMPPKEKLSAAEIADLAAWVKMGAPDPRVQGAAVAGVDFAKGREFWSFRPVKDYPPPAVADAEWPLTPIDRFILKQLETKGLTPVGPADKRTLIRRATFDLTGLPPTPDEVAAFLADDSPAAFARVVERLLASSAYGERWGRHWLDVVRYADTAGDNSDYPAPLLYKYRNWVIRAFRADMPYDRFVREQLAGDLLGKDEGGRMKDEKKIENNPTSTFDSVIATGYLANARRFGSYEDERYPWYLTYEDTIDNFGRTFLGLTINCARCHDHKFDPISQEDYYALYGIFQSTRYPWAGTELDKAPHDLVPLAPTDQVEASLKDQRQKLAAFDAKTKQLEADKAAANKALKEAEKANEAERKERIAAANKQVEAVTAALKAVAKDREACAKRPLPFDAAYAVAEARPAGKKKVGNACVQIKGDPEHLGKEVPRRFPTVLGGQMLGPSTTGSGRLDLARWVTDPANPLFARVMANRIWHYHFGHGLVPTPSDFGKQGRPPTHPELLDYLARRFIESGWSIKAMHRTIMLSRVYQFSGRDNAANTARDAANESLWRFPRRRLDAESIRDALLAASGSLDRSVGGPHPFPEQTTWNFTQHNPFKAVYDTNRRSVYLMTQRIQRHPFLALFDGPDTNASTAARTTSTTALQALYLMNDPFVHEQARRFAARLLAGKKDDGGCIEEAYQIAFARPVTAEEKTAAQAYLAAARDKLKANGVPADQVRRKAWESFVRALFLSNEFVYVD